MRKVLTVAWWMAVVVLLLFFAGGGVKHVYGQTKAVPNASSEGLSQRPETPKAGDVLQFSLTPMQADAMRGMQTLKPNDSSVYLNSEYVVMSTETFQVLATTITQMTYLLKAMQAELAKPPEVMCKKGESV